MQSKEKRKTNPRRRLLMRLIVGIVIIGIVTVLAWRALQPTGAQIVYIAPDENGYDAIWLADLNDPEHPRQLTFHEGMFIRNFQVSEANRIIFYALSDLEYLDPHEFWIMNLDTGEHEKLPFCRATQCRDVQLHPNGQWVTYEDYGAPSNQIYIYDLRSHEKQPVCELEEGQFCSFPRWLMNTNRLAFRLSSGTGIRDYTEFAFYDIEEQRITNTMVMNADIFADDGFLYEYYLRYSGTILSELNDTNHSELIHDLLFPVYDWHPNNEDVLLVENFSVGDKWARHLRANIHLFNIITGESEILASPDINYPQPSFNADGSQILYASDIMGSNYDYEIILFDMETREEITLPIIGRSPQWVNGGR